VIAQRIVRNVWLRQAAVATPAFMVAISVVGLLTRHDLRLATKIVYGALDILLVFLAYRGFRVGIYVTKQDVEVHNYWKTIRFPWADVSQVRSGPRNIPGLTSSVGFVLNDGYFIKSDSATSLSKRRIRSMTADVLESAPSDVYQRSTGELKTFPGGS
jgi:hypothetical protein